MNDSRVWKLRHYGEEKKNTVTAPSEQFERWQKGLECVLLPFQGKGRHPFGTAPTPFGRKWFTADAVD